MVPSRLSDPAIHRNHPTNLYMLSRIEHLQFLGLEQEEPSSPVLWLGNKATRQPKSAQSQVGISILESSMENWRSKFTMNKARKSTTQKCKPKARKHSSKASSNNPNEIKSQNSTHNELPLELQQLLLNIFENSFARPDSRPLAEVVQEVKGHLYNRDFAAAFDKDEYLHAYAARWSAGRAMGYLKLLDGIFEVYLDCDAAIHNNALSVLCLGGGAGAELAALTGVVKLRSQPTPSRDEAVLEDLVLEDKPAIPPFHLDATLVDIANWQTVIETLHRGATVPPLVSAFASTAAKSASVPLIPESSLTATFIQRDILELTESDLRDMVAGKHLITLFFTLNELYSTSVAKAQSFLLKLTQAVDEGVLLLVVDSAGSYSTVSLNGQEKKYPMHWLADHALLKSLSTSGSEGATTGWQKLQKKESEWFRLPEGLKYPLELENMRYQLHLYRRS